MSVNISTDDLGSAINAYLQEMSQQVSEGLKHAAVVTAKSTVDYLHTNSPKRTKTSKHAVPGAYAKNWASSETQNRFGTSVTVYNRNYYQLTHLLEYGHADRAGGRVDGIPHIEPASQLAAQAFEANAKQCIEEELGR